MLICAACQRHQLQHSCHCHYHADGGPHRPTDGQRASQPRAGARRRWPRAGASRRRPCRRCWRRRSLRRGGRAAAHAALRREQRVERRLARLRTPCAATLRRASRALRSAAEGHRQPLSRPTLRPFTVTLLLTLLVGCPPRGPCAGGPSRRTARSIDTVRAILTSLRSRPPQNPLYSQCGCSPESTSLMCAIVCRSLSSSFPGETIDASRGPRVFG